MAGSIQPDTPRMTVTPAFVASASALSGNSSGTFANHSVSSGADQSVPFTTSDPIADGNSTDSFTLVDYDITVTDSGIPDPDDDPGVMAKILANLPLIITGIFVGLTLSIGLMVAMYQRRSSILELLTHRNQQPLMTNYDTDDTDDTDVSSEQDCDEPHSSNEAFLTNSDEDLREFTDSFV